MITVTYAFRDYSPININLNSEQDPINLNIVLSYVMQGAQVRHDTSTEVNNPVYFVDMTWEENKEV